MAFLDRPGHPLIISGSYDRRLIWWNADNGQTIRNFDPPVAENATAAK